MLQNFGIPAEFLQNEFSNQCGRGGEGGGAMQYFAFFFNLRCLWEGSFQLIVHKILVHFVLTMFCCRMNYRRGTISLTLSFPTINSTCLSPQRPFMTARLLI